MKIKDIVLAAIFGSLFFVLDLFSIKVGNVLKIGVSGLPIVIIAMTRGKWTAVLTALVGTFISQVIQYGIGPTTVLWLLPHCIRAFFLGLFLFKKDNSNFIYILLIVILSGIILTICNVGVTYVDAVVYGYYTKELLYAALGYKFLAGLASSIIYTVISIPLVNALKKAKVFD